MSVESPVGRLRYSYLLLNVWVQHVIASHVLLNKGFVHSLTGRVPRAFQCTGVASVAIGVGNFPKLGSKQPLAYQRHNLDGQAVAQDVGHCAAFALLETKQAMRLEELLVVSILCRRRVPRLSEASVALANACVRASALLQGPCAATRLGEEAERQGRRAVARPRRDFFYTR